MQNFPLLALLVFLLPFSISSQSNTVTTSVFFKSDQYDLTETEKTKLDSFIATLAGKPLKSIEIAGNTDSDADSLYNIRLSQNRTTTVREYLKKNGFDHALFSTAFFGENKPVAINDAESGKQKNRRVDIIATLKPVDINPVNPVPDKPKEPTLIIEKEAVTTDTCLSDTTILLPQGSRYTINLCDYRKYKDCIKVTEYLTAESILNSNLTTLTASGQQLMTGGMADIKICDSVKLLKPLKYRIPVISMKTNDCDQKVTTREMLFWGMDKNGRWISSKKAKKVLINDTLYYELQVKGSHMCNLDIPIPKAPSIKTKFKTKGKIQLVSVRVFYGQSIYQIKTPKKNKARIELYGCPAGICNCIEAKAVGINSEGDTLEIQQCLNDFKKRRPCLRCSQGGVSSKSTRLWGFIPVRTASVYRKYIIRARDWKMVEMRKGN